MQNYSPARLKELARLLEPAERIELESLVAELDRREVLARCSKDCLHWLQHWTATEDDHWLEKGTHPEAPFPDKPYFAPILEAFQQDSVVFVPKSREMMTSWLACGFIAWMVRWHPQLTWVLQTVKEKKAAKLVNYCRILLANQPAWMRAGNVVVSDNTMELTVAQGGSILGIPGGADQIRMHHPYGYLMDEAAHLPESEACYNVAKPVVKKLIAISTAAPGWFGRMCQR